MPLTLTTLPPLLLQAPAHLPASVGVLVEEGPGCFLVKVSCKDRHGLLSDITSAIGGLPLQVRALLLLLLVTVFFCIVWHMCAWGAAAAGACAAAAAACHCVFL
jgi:hypothetical protein